MPRGLLKNFFAELVFFSFLKFGENLRS